MPRRRILFSWIGHNDLRPMAASQPAKVRDEILGKLGNPPPSSGEGGPIKTLLDCEAFDEVFLLSNYSPDWTNRYIEWLGHGSRAILVDLENPTNYTAIFTIVDAELRKIRERKDWKEIDLSFHLSPGSPAMTAVWLLVGKSRYPATFYQTHKGKAWVTDVPFDLTVDFVPELLRDADKQLQHLATQGPSEVSGFEHIAGDCRATRLAVGRAKRAAMRAVPVLLLGESGTGKEMFARAIHEASPRRGRPFVPVNCAAISRELLESELFGHVKGAFTGAEHARKGAFEEADGGTLFLDEVGECDPSLQAKLLRVLQPPDGAGPCRRRFRRVGDSKEIDADVRVIAATNRDLHKAVRDGQFREDLYYRLAVITVKLPPLRDRREDIPKIVERLLGDINRQFRSEEPRYGDKSVSDTAISFVKRHGWPGNIRQLYNVLLQAAVMAEGDVLERNDLVAALAEMPEVDRSIGSIADAPIGDGFNLEEHLNEVQRQYLRRAMEEVHGVKAQAAKLLGYKNYQTLDAQLKRLKVKGNWK